MVCNKCGKNLPDGAKFCNVCGRPVKAKRKKRTKKKVILLCAIGLVVLAAAVAAAMVLNNVQIWGFTNMIENQKYNDALDSYDEMSREERTKADEWLADYVLEVAKRYYDGSYDYTAAYQILQDLTEFLEVRDEALEAAQEIQQDNAYTVGYQTAQRYAEEKKWKEAYLALQEIHTDYRRYDEVVTLREQCVTNYREDVLAKCESCATRNAYDELLTMLAEAEKVLPDDTQLALSYQEYIDQYVDQTLDRATELANQEDCQGAIDLLTEAKNIYQADAFDDAIAEYDYQIVLANYNEMIAQEDYILALQYIESASCHSKYQDQINQLQAKCRQNLIEQTLTIAKTYADARKFQNAVDEIERVQSIYDCQEFQDQVKIYRESLPRALADCHVIDSNNVAVGFSAIDCFGNEYEKAIGMAKHMYNSGGNVTFFLDGHYVRLNGIFIGGNQLSSSAVAYCKIYADTNLIFESDGLSRTSYAATFDLDVTGISQLRIEFRVESGSWDYATILDATVS